MRIDRPSGPDAPDAGDRGRGEADQATGMCESVDPFGARSEIERRDEWAAQAQAVKEDRERSPRRVLAKASEAETPPEPAAETAGRREDSGREQKPGAKPEDRGWQTATEVIGQPKAWRSFDAAKRELGPVSGNDWHHIVEQCQGGSKRSGFGVEQINHSDNLASIPRENVHKEISRLYSRNVPGLGVTLRDTMDGEPWEYQYDYGCRVVDQEMRRNRDHDDD